MISKKDELIKTKLSEVAIIASFIVMGKKLVMPGSHDLDKIEGENRKLLLQTMADMILKDAGVKTKLNIEEEME
jgi:putative Ca2+/H+ antiporter (TMEM165/GDT1 family)